MDIAIHLSALDSLKLESKTRKRKPTSSKEIAITASGAIPGAVVCRSLPSLIDELHQ